MLAAMGSVLRTRALLVAWLVLALLPLRGWANVVMHLPAPHATAAGCHDGAAAATAHAGHHAQAPPGEAAPHASSCTLCDLCHGAALPCCASSPRRDYAPPRVELAAAVELGSARAPHRRPPRG